MFHVVAVASFATSLTLQVADAPANLADDSGSPPAGRRLHDRPWRGRRAAAVLFLALLAEDSPNAAEIGLVWDAVDDPRVARYQLHHGLASGDYDSRVEATKTTAVVSGLQAGRRYYFAVRACAADGVTCSGFSNEVSAVVSELAAPVAAFTASARAGAAPFTTVFSDQSIGEISTREWSLGDGTSSTAATVVHTYSVAGTYGVSVTVSGPGGSATETKTAFIEVTQADPPPVVTAAQALAAGEVWIDHRWRWVAFPVPFTDPIVVAKPLSANGGDPAVVRVAGIAPDGFWIRVQEWDYLDGWHVPETVSYLVMERGRHEVAEGVWVEAGRVESGPAGRPVTVSFAEAFAEAPLVFAAVSSVNEADTVTARLDAIDTLGFQVTLQEQEANVQEPAAERVDYIAWPPSTGVFNGRRFEVARTAEPITHEPYTLSLGGGFEGETAFLAEIQTTQGGDPVALRWRSRAEWDFDLWLEEERSADAEVNHVPEDAGYLLIQTE